MTKLTPEQEAIVAKAAQLCLNISDHKSYIGTSYAPCLEAFDRIISAAIAEALSDPVLRRLDYIEKRMFGTTNGGENKA